MLRLNVGYAVWKGFLEEKSRRAEEHSRLEWKNVCVGGGGNTEISVLIKNWGEGHEEETDMQSVTSENPKDWAETCGCFQTGCGRSQRIMANISSKE